jgi:anti-anti-sigma factor
MSIQQIPCRSSLPGDGEPRLSVAVAAHGPVTVVVVSGELDISTVQLLTDLVHHLVQQAPFRLVLDLAQVTFFCADGIRALQRVRRAATASAVQLILRDPSPITMKVLTVGRALDLFTVETASSVNPVAGPYARSARDNTAHFRVV